MHDKSKIIFVLCSVTALAFIVQSENVKGKIVCFGDSITYGASVEGNGWPEQLSKLDNEITVINSGRKGRRTSDRNELLPVLEKNKDADYLLLLLGVNDLKDGNDSLVAVCVDNIKWMIEKVKKEIPGVKIILMSPCQINMENMTELNRNKKYNCGTAASLIKLDEKYKKLAGEESVGFVSLLNVVSPENFLDGIHPSIAGYTEITMKIWNKLISFTAE